MHPLRPISLIFAALALVACGPDPEPQLMNIRSQSAGPDEFAILPGKPLQMPENLASLPAPTPGGSNLTDPTPEADAILALGGRPGAAVASDAGLIAYTSRMGVSPTIRSDLATADLAYRQQNNGRLLERLFDTNVYFDAYAPLELDKRAELERLRAAGIRTPQVPPPPVQ